jgi:integrase
MSAKYPKPFFRPSRRLWYVQLEGKQLNLGPNRDAAFLKYHELMRRPRSARVNSDTVAAVVDLFLDWCHKHRAADTYVWYQSRLQLFVTLHSDLTIAALRPFHVQQWVDAYEHLSSGSNRNYCRAIQRALRWAEAQGLIERSPIAHLQKPRAGRREVIISPEEYQRILKHVPNEEFRDLLTFAWETGARAEECLVIERRHVDLDHARIVIPRGEEKMERAPRVIYLSQTASKLVQRRMCRTHNHLFVNTNGRPWTTDALNCAFNSVRHRMGKAVMRERGLEILDADVQAFVPKLRPVHRVNGELVDKTPSILKDEARRKLKQRLAATLAPKYCLTNFRHSWCHHALCRGLDALTVSVLMGHADPSMVARVYSHLSHAADYLHEAANRAVG